MAPQGAVGLESRIEITFSEPMVALTDLDADSAAGPVQIEPRPPGSWRWEGTRTIRFEARPRLPMATSYRVRIPAGTEAPNGARLSETVEFEFHTPTPQIEHWWPQNRSVTAEPVLVLLFDQAIDPDSAAAAMQVEVRGRVLPVSPVAKEDIPDLPSGDWLDSHPNNWVAVRPPEKLPLGASCVLRVGPFLPSAEGPRRSKEFREIHFATYSPLLARPGSCTEGACAPGEPLEVTFNNPLDAASRNDSLVVVTPPIPGMKIHWQPAGFSIVGRTRGRTLYAVRLDPTIADMFGQKLGGGKSVTFQTGTASPALFQFLPANFILDPEGPRVHPIYSINVRRIRCRLSRVAPGDWGAFGSFQRNLRGHVGILPGTMVLDTVLVVPGGGEEFVETPFDLNRALHEGVGQCVLLVEPLIPPREAARLRYAAWIQSTRIGLDALDDDGQLVVWATDLRDGSPLSGVEVTLQNGFPAVRGIPLPAGGFTSPTGVANLPLPNELAVLLVARLGRDVAILPASTPRHHAEWVRKRQNTHLAGSILCDRGLYQPGEELHFKGWIREMNGPEGVAFPPADMDSVEFELRDGERTRQTGKLPLSGLFGFSGTITLPQDFPPGTGYLAIRAHGYEGGRDPITRLFFRVEEFRRPEYTASLKADPGPWRLGDRVTATLTATQFTGAGLADVPVTWKVEASAGYFAPPNWGRFQFRGDPHNFGESSAERKEQQWSGSLEGRTDQTGTHVLKLDVRRIDPPVPVSVQVRAAASDLNRQTFADATSFLVHPSDVYVGLRSRRRFILRGDPIEVDFIVVTVDGDAVRGRPVDLECVRLETVTSDGKVDVREVRVSGTRVESRRAPRTVKLGTALKEGHYVVRAHVTDAEGRRNRSAMPIRVEETSRPQAGSSKFAVQNLSVECDQDDYAVGDTVTILVHSPLHPARGLLTISGRSISSVMPFHQDGPVHAIRTIVPKNSPTRLEFSVVLNGREPRRNKDGEVESRLPHSPATAAGNGTISVQPRDRELTVRIAPARSVADPGDTTLLSLSVTDATGRPEPGAEAAVIVVDESILSLVSHSFPNPLHSFLPGSTRVQRHSSRNLIQIFSAEEIRKSLDEMVMEGARSGGAMMGGIAAGLPMATLSSTVHFRGSRSAPLEVLEEFGAAGVERFDSGVPRLRTLFSPVALFVGTVVTDERGAAALPLRLPDNLTRYRIVAIAAAGRNRFGVGESSITARLSLMVRPSPPRFLNAGDRFELPFIVENQTDEPVEAVIGARAVNAVFTAGRGRRVVLPPHRRTEVRFPCETRAPGEITAQVAVAGGGLSDAAEVRIPIWTPATVEAFATYGEIDGNGTISYEVAPPPDVHPEYGGLDLSTSSTALQSLTDAVLYLHRYPYECTEQKASRVLAISALRDVLQAFGVPGLPDSATLANRMADDLLEVERAQVADGGFSFWPGSRSYPWLGVYVPHVLHLARLKGYPVSGEALSRSVEYLRKIPYLRQEHGTRESRIVLRSYALYVLALLGHVDAAAVADLVSEAGLENLSMDSAAWLLGAVSGHTGSAPLRGALGRHILNHVTETAGLAHVITEARESDQLLLGSDRRVDAVVLDALLSEGIASSLVPKLARSLLAHRRNGRWRSTQENAFVLMALEHYFRSAEGVTPDFAAQCWLGDVRAAEFRYRGRTTDRQEVSVPMSALVADAGPGVARTASLTPATSAAASPSWPLLLAKKGPGRMYYRLGLRWAPKNATIPAEDAGFHVTRRYAAMDDSADVVRDSIGTVHVRAGARVRVTVQMTTPSRRYHVALVDPLPGGFEPLNPVLRGSDLSPGIDRAAGGWWFDHQNLRNERAEAFCSWLPEGNYSWSYLARATTPGEFTVPPPRAEEMYSPETFGRGEGTRLVVEARE